LIKPSNSAANSHISPLIKVPKQYQLRPFVTWLFYMVNGALPLLEKEKEAH
jgi:hypothetical protein